MPYIALHNGEKKGAWEAPKQTDVECPTCGGTMRVWDPDDKARHFKHIGNMRGSGATGTEACESVSESGKHMKWKNFAAERLEEAFEGNVADCSMEKAIDTPNSTADRRVADVMLTFEEPDWQLGDGIVVEVQHRNKGKDIDQTTRDFVDNDYAVAWTYSRHYATDRCLLDELGFRRLARHGVVEHYLDSIQDKVLDSIRGAIQHHEKYRRGFRRNSQLDKKIPAKIPREYFDEKAMEMWQGQRWGELFDYPESKGYVAEVRGTSHGVEVPATIPAEYFSQTNDPKEEGGVVPGRRGPNHESRWGVAVADVPTGSTKAWAVNRAEIWSNRRDSGTDAD